MRHTTRFPLIALVLFTSACVGTVGEDPGGGSRKPKENEKTPPGCEDPEEVKTPVTIRSDADFATLPKGCWDLFAKLRVEGPNIASLAKLGQLKGVNDLELVDTSLKTIDTQLPLAVWGAVTITGNKQLTSLANMPVDNADDLTTAYTIRGNPLLTSLDGIKYVKNVEGELRISDNAALADITLDELVSATTITIANTGATRVDLGSLQTVGRIEIANNPKLATFDGLAAQRIQGDFVLRGNPALQTLGNVGAIQRIEGSLTIDGMNGVKNLDAFSGLQFITSSLTITNNTTLDSVARMARLSGIGTTVTVTGNAALPYCGGHEIDHCVTSGAVTVTNNKPNTQNAQCACWCQP